MTFDAAHLGYLVPYLILAIVGLLLVLAEAFFKGKDRTALVGLPSPVRSRPRSRR